jgi:hypothetical protein
MNYPKYDLETSSSEDIFEFNSIGQKGDIRKIIQFKQTDLHPRLYNLAFGDKNEDGSVDDRTISDNGDMEKVLATVATTVYEYTSNYSNREIIFSGSTPSRTRLYRMAIGKNYEELSKDFYIFGVIVESGVGKKVPFSNNTDYIAFIVERKPLKLEL